MTAYLVGTPLGVATIFPPVTPRGTFGGSPHCFAASVMARGELGSAVGGRAPFGLYTGLVRGRRYSEGLSKALRYGE